MAELNHLIWLTTRRGLRPARIPELLRRFGSAEAVYYAEEAQLTELDLGPSVLEALKDRDLSGAERVLEDCDRLGLRILTFRDGDYPERLLQLADYPPVLYVRGRLPRFDEELALAMVGSRACSEYGRRMAGRLSFDLTRAGALVVTGLAQGIDSAALRGALQAGGPAVCVLAGGVDVIYPRQNRWLYEDIAAAGTILSENPPGTRPEGWRFPLRNRILSGLSAGVIAVEAEANSGTLITARLALEQDRDVFAVPGPADAPMSVGTNGLISGGCARLIRQAEDVLEEYTLRFPGRLKAKTPVSEEERRERLSVKPPPETAGSVRDCPKSEADGSEEAPPELPVLDPGTEAMLADQEKEVLALLAGETLSADELVERTGMPVRRVNTALTVLQVRGLLQEFPGRRFSAAVRLT